MKPKPAEMTSFFELSDLRPLCGQFAYKTASQRSTSHGTLAGAHQAGRTVGPLSPDARLEPLRALVLSVSEAAAGLNALTWRHLLSGTSGCFNRLAGVGAPRAVAPATSDEWMGAAHGATTT